MFVGSIVLGLGLVVEELLVATWSPVFYRRAPLLWRKRVRRHPSLLQTTPESVFAESVNDNRVWQRIVFRRLSDTELAFRESFIPSPRINAGLAGIISEESAGVFLVSTRIGSLGLAIFGGLCVFIGAQADWTGAGVFGAILLAGLLMQKARLHAMCRSMEAGIG